MIPFRVGYGIDIHRLIAGDGFLLGGVWIKSNLSIKAHSDGDIVYHAVADSFLGAIADGDIGKHFPDTDPLNKDINSAEIVKFCYNLVQNRGYKIGNIDITIVLQKPKIREYIDIIRGSIANLLNLSIDQVSLKATTSEKMGFVGKSEGITVHSTVLIYK